MGLADLVDADRGEQGEPGSSPSRWRSGGAGGRVPTAVPRIGDLASGPRRRGSGGVGGGAGLVAPPASEATTFEPPPQSMADSVTTSSVTVTSVRVALPVLVTT